MVVALVTINLWSILYNCTDCLLGNYQPGAGGAGDNLEMAQLSPPAQPRPVNSNK